jgi:glycosyltransferase involved in cell wall biosynthesis
LQISVAIGLGGEQMGSWSSGSENGNAQMVHTLDPNLSVNGGRGAPISILCLTTSLGVGGAEMMLYKFLSGMDRTRFTAKVISLINLGPVGKKIQLLGIPVRSLGMVRGKPNPMSVLRLARWLREDAPDVIQTWMYHADLVGGLGAKLAGGIPVVWGIHHTLIHEGNKRLTLQTVRACARLSRWLPKRIVCCSYTSQQVHTVLGYAAEKMLVIPNGSDLTAFKPDSAARVSIRRELQIPDDAPIIGHVGRFHPQKDHHNFIQAAALLHESRPDAYFILCGDDVMWENAELVRWIDEVGIRSRCRLLGRRDDMPRLTAALDVASSSSCYGEAFPMVIGEAMGCGVPCVVTHVGDSALIVGETGRVVPPQNPQALFIALRRLIELGREERSQLGMAARRRIKEHFDLPDIVARYQNLYRELAVRPA